MKKRFSFQVRRGMTLGLAIGKAQIKVLKQLERAGEFVDVTQAQVIRDRIFDASRQYEAYVRAAAQWTSTLAASNMFEFAVIETMTDTFLLAAMTDASPKAMQALQAQMIKTVYNSFEQIGMKVTQAINDGAQA